MFENADRIAEQYSELLFSARPSADSLLGQIASGRARDIVAVDSNGSVLLLIATPGPLAGVLPRNFESLRLVPPTEYVIQINGELQRDRFTAIVLPESRHEVLVAFTVLAAGLLAGLPDSPTQLEVQGFLDGFVDLFRSSPSVHENAVKGVWGELWTILNSGRPSEFLPGWNSSARARFDFAFSGLNLEVKTHEGHRHLHHFSHAQLVSEPDQTIVISLLIREDAAGHTIAELMDQISLLVSVDSRKVLIQKVFGILGTSFESSSTLSYSLDDPHGVRGVFASGLDRVEVPTGAMIDQIIYRVDISEPLVRLGMPFDELLKKVVPISSH